MARTIRDPRAHERAMTISLLLFSLSFSFTILLPFVVSVHDHVRIMVKFQGAIGFQVCYMAREVPSHFYSVGDLRARSGSNETRSFN